jgi:hypothetical protein
MTTPFVASVRTRRETIRLGAAGAPTITIRVQLAEAWDAVRIDTPPSEPVLAVKVAALAALGPETEFHEDYVMKLRGFEVLDERASLSEVGAANGSIFLLAFRRRRPVR